jgi:hypothetical protein
MSPTRPIAGAAAVAAILLTTMAPAAAAQILTERPPTTAPTIMSDATPPVVAVSAIPAGVRVSWQPVTGASGYTLCRASPPGSTTCTVLTASQLAATTLAYHDFGLPPGGTHAYRVTAWRPDGHYGTAAPVTGTAGAVANPTNFVVKYDSSNAATPVIVLGWDSFSYWKADGQQVPVTTFRLMGTGLSTAQMVNGTSYRVVLGSGDHNWSLTGMIPNPAGGWYESATPSTTSFKALVKYRLVALGFKVLEPATESLVESDGTGNEAFAAATIASTTTAFALPTVYSLRSPTYGEVTGSGKAFPGRIRAGTAARQGGLAKGDVVPAGLSLQAATGTVSTTGFPLLLWEGRLSSTGMIVVHPTLWEEDNSATSYNGWLGRVEGLAKKAYQAPDYPTTVITTLRDAGQTGPGGPGPITAVCFETLILTNPDLCVVQGHHRPLGLAVERDALSNSAPVGRWYDRPVVLTQASIEAALRGVGTQPGTAPGVIVIPLREKGTEFQASYELYLRVERLP